MSEVTRDLSAAVALRDAIAKAQGFPHGPRETHARPGLGLTERQTDVTRTDAGTYTVSVPDESDTLAVSARLTREESDLIAAAVAESRSGGADVAGESRTR